MTIAKENIVASFSKLNVMVIGDVMVDSYLWGNVDRISPEAPVPVIQMTSRENRLGGAANVAKNIIALGAKVFLCSVLGKDDKSDVFNELMLKNKLSTEGLIYDPKRQTTTKTRILSGSQQMMRVDQENTSLITKETAIILTDKIKQIIENKSIDVVIFEDYDKGVINPYLITEVVKHCKKNNIPTSVDPKKRHFLHYSNVSLFKPNLKELVEGIKMDVNPKDITSIRKAVLAVKDQLDCDMVMITLSKHGVYISNGNEDFLIDAHIRNIADVSGAGDTVITIASLALALGFEIQKIAQLSNIAGGLVCENIGVVPINKSTFQTEINQLL